jgi:hypothetical protein
MPCDFKLYRAIPKVRGSFSIFYLFFFANYISIDAYTQHTCTHTHMNTRT